MSRVKIRFLGTILLLFAVVLAACGGAPAAPAEPAAPEAPAAEGDATTSESSTEAPTGEFTHQVVRFNTMADYEAATGNQITEFHQAPMLDAQVADGTLPPVEERLPDEPLILQPADQIGEYGGTMVNVHEGNFDFLEDLLREFPHVYGSDMQGVWPNVFMNAESSEDGRTFTFTIRPGIKWSDGEPFGADDFVFWYDAIASNTDLNPNGVNDMKAGGEMGTLTKVDENTIEMNFVAPYGVLLERLNRWRPMPYAPAHYLKQFHPGYTDPDEVNAIAEERGYSNWVELFQSELDWHGNPDIPTIFAWRTVTRAPAFLFRN